MEIYRTTAQSCPVRIWIAGDADRGNECGRILAESSIQEWADRVGACVTLTRTTYIYSHGKEYGWVVGFINYPRFPLTERELMAKAEELAKILIEKLNQDTCSIEGPHQTVWLSRRSSELELLKQGKK